MRRLLIGLLLALTCGNALWGLRLTWTRLPTGDRPSVLDKLSRYETLRGPLRTVRHARFVVDPQSEAQAFARLYRAQYVLVPTILHMTSLSSLPRGTGNDQVVIFDFRRQRELEAALDESRRTLAAVGLRLEMITVDGGLASVRLARQHPAADGEASSRARRTTP